MLLFRVLIQSEPFVSLNFEQCLNSRQIWIHSPFHKLHIEQFEQNLTYEHSLNKVWILNRVWTMFEFKEKVWTKFEQNGSRTHFNLLDLNNPWTNENKDRTEYELSPLILNIVWTKFEFEHNLNILWTEFEQSLNL